VAASLGRESAMTIRPDLMDDDASPIFFTPFVSSLMRVEHGWIDYNGHMNLAYYNTLFDRAMDEAMALCGLGPAYVDQRNMSFFLVESRISYKQELTSDDPVRVTLQMIDCDDKRVHCYLEIRHAQDGWVAASAENLLLHVDLAFRRAAVFPPDIRRSLNALRDAHRSMPQPERLGQGVGMPPRRTMN
jgi:acyl-CoA thioester hydrolase